MELKFIRLSLSTFQASDGGSNFTDATYSDSVNFNKYGYIK